MLRVLCFFIFKQKTAYEMRISDWSSDVCSSDLATLCRAKKSRVTRNFVASCASALAPFSQNSSFLVQSASGKAQLGHLKPPGWFIDKSARDPLVTTLCSSSTFAVAAAAPQPPAGLV